MKARKLQKIGQLSLVCLVLCLTVGAVPAFSDGGAGADFPNDTVTTIALQPDGKAIIGGQFSDSRIMRKNADGSTDTGFSSSWSIAGFNASVNTVVVQSDGKVLIGGEFTRFDISLSGGLVRLNSDGSLDADFARASGVGFDEGVTAISVANDGKIYVGGRFSTFDGVPVGRVVRLNADGSLDTAFQADAAITAPPLALLEHPTTKDLLVGGPFEKFLISLKNNGVLDVGQ